MSEPRTDEMYVRIVFNIKFSVRHKTVVVRDAAKQKQGAQSDMVAYEYTYQDHEYIIRTKHEWFGRFLLQAAHKIFIFIF